jgi:hypothetical protein
MSKGNSQRPTDKKQFDENYDKIFGKKPVKNREKDPYFKSYHNDMGPEYEDVVTPSDYNFSLFGGQYG